MIISGSDFGATKGTGSAWLGSNYATVVSWSQTQIVATVASNATTGTARVQQSGAWSNSVPFTLNTATISSVTPSSGLPGTQVTIVGSYFGATQNSGQVWLGTGNGTVQSWSDTQVVALVATGSASGNAQILQNGVVSNTFPFDVNSPKITSVSPSSGNSGTSVTFSGTGFGSSQGTGSVWLGSTPGLVVSWADTEVVATVSSTALTGIAQVQQDGVRSNAVAFTVPVSSGSGITLVPNLLNLVAGETHMIQALDEAGQPVAGLTWTSSDATVVSLSSDDPPLLSALTAGRVTISAGSASTDVTVSVGALALGTVIWSNPANGSEVWLIPAVPSPSGVADVFAFQTDGSTVQAITSDGATAWTADTSLTAQIVPDFMGGLVLANFIPGNYPILASVVALDGITGQPHPAYTPPSPVTLLPGGSGSLFVHTDGTIFLLNDDPQVVLTGIDATTGTQKFTIPVDGYRMVVGLIIAGDGHAYVPFVHQDAFPSPSYTGPWTHHLRVLRVDTAGGTATINLADWTSDAEWPSAIPFLQMITNADQGIMVSWKVREYSWQGVEDDQAGMSTITGTSATDVGQPQIPGQGAVVPQVQAQDGSFVGFISDDANNYYMIAFEATGNVRWTVPNEFPWFATADGGVVAYSGITYDRNGNATGQTATLPTQAWTGNAYQVGSVDRVLAAPIFYGLSWWPFQGANPSAYGTAHFRRDSISNNKVKSVLTPVRWQQFANSHCGAVLANPQGMTAMIPNYSLQVVQTKQGMTNFYDVGNPGVGSLPLREVTGGQYGDTRTLTVYLNNANAVAANLGYSRQTAVILSANYFAQQQHPEFTLVHEIIFHAYAGLVDDAVFGNAYFTAQGLWRPADSSATTNITTWMSTDCRCTPGNPAAPSCQANTATW